MGANLATYTRKECAAVIGVNVRTLWVWENDEVDGTKCRPSRRMAACDLWSKRDIERLAKLKGYTPDWSKL